jgi:hypothetical protein
MVTASLETDGIPDQVMLVRGRKEVQREIREIGKIPNRRLEVLYYQSLSTKGG